MEDCMLQTYNVLRQFIQQTKIMFIESFKRKGHLFSNMITIMSFIENKSKHLHTKWGWFLKQVIWDNKMAG